MKVSLNLCPKTQFRGIGTVKICQNAPEFTDRFFSTLNAAARKEMDSAENMGFFRDIMDDFFKNFKGLAKGEFAGANADKFEKLHRTAQNDPRKINFMLLGAQNDFFKFESIVNKELLPLYDTKSRDGFMTFLKTTFNVGQKAEEKDFYVPVTGIYKNLKGEDILVANPGFALTETIRRIGFVRPR